MIRRERSMERDGYGDECLDDTIYRIIIEEMRC